MILLGSLRNRLIRFVFLNSISTSSTGILKISTHIDNITNNQKLILIQIGAKSYYINADTTRAGVEEFLKNKDRNWKIIKSNRGNLNKITNSDKEISGFYIYKLIN